MIKISNKEISNEVIFQEDLELEINGIIYTGKIKLDENNLYATAELMPKIKNGDELEIINAVTKFVNTLVKLDGFDEIADIRIVQLLGEQIIPLITPSIERYAQEKGNGATPKAGGKRIL